MLMLCGECIRGLHFGLIVVAEGGHHTQVSFPYRICNKDHHRGGFPTDLLASTGSKLHPNLPHMSEDVMWVKKPL